MLTEFLVGHGLGSGDAAVPFAVGLGVLDLVLGDFDKYGHNFEVKSSSRSEAAKPSEELRVMS